MRVDEHTITFDQSPVFYRSAPAGDPPPLYLHGIPTSSDDWLDLLARTGGIAPDLIGFGRTGKGGHLDYGLDGLAEFLERLLDHLEIPKVRLVGHEWGAAAGLALARRDPDRVERIALVCPLRLAAGARRSRYGRIWRRPLLGELAMGATTKWLLTRALTRATAQPGVWTRERMAAVWEQFDQGTQRAILRLYRSTEEPQLAELADALAALHVPKLILWGESDPWFTADDAQALARGPRDATLESIPDAGHWPWLEQQSAADSIANFLG